MIGVIAAMGAIFFGFVSLIQEEPGTAPLASLLFFVVASVSWVTDDWGTLVNAIAGVQ